MKSIVAAAGLLALCTTAAMAEPPSYPMVCRGGPMMRIMVNHDVNGAGIPGATAMFVYFNKAPTGASMAPPPPGSCAWLDRPLNAAEPAVLWIKSPEIAFAFQVLGNGQVVHDTTGPRLNVEGATISPEAHRWDSIVRAVMTGGTFEVHAYNSGGSVMVITSVP
jgi:hypothetical protein